jgi:hypothetical protein
VEPITERLGPVARELFALWWRLPRQGLVPERRNFDPMTAVRILPVISVIEREGPDAWRFRIVGTEIERRWGQVFTGCDCLANVSAQAASVMQREFRTVLEFPCGSRSLRRVRFGSGRTSVIETLRLPLRGKDGTNSQILSCSGELGGDIAFAVDTPREVITIAEQEYVDIGAGCPPQGAIP